VSASGWRKTFEISAPADRRVCFDVADFYHSESRLLGLDTLKRD
jgi:NADPH2:quinone reductase